MIRPIAAVAFSQVGGGPGAVGVGIIAGPGGIGQFVDIFLVSVVGDTISPHGPAPHNAAVITTGDPDCLVNGLPLARVGDEASCGCTVLTGIPHTLAD